MNKETKAETKNSFFMGEAFQSEGGLEYFLHVLVYKTSREIVRIVGQKSTFIVNH